jgi:hydrogenase maturation protease
MKSRQSTDRAVDYLIIGTGNILLSDEGIGIHILELLKKENNLEKTGYVDIGTSSLDIGLHLGPGIKKIVIIDCIKADGFDPGTVFKLTIDDLRKRQQENFSLHQFELVDSLKLLDLVDNLPETMILGIVPENIEVYSLELSPALKKDLPVILTRVRKEITNFLKQDA